MKNKLPAIITLLFCTILSGYAVWGSGIANNPQSGISALSQGPSADGNGGWPFAIVNATGTSLDVNLVGSIAPQSVIQDVASNPWIVGFNGISQPINGNVGSTTTGIPGDTFTAPAAIPQAQVFPMIWNGNTWDQLRDANKSAGSSGVGVLGSGTQYFRDVGTWGRWTGDLFLLNPGTGIHTQMASANGAAGSLGDGIMGSGGMYWDGAAWQKWLDANKLLTSAGGTFGIQAMNATSAFDTTLLNGMWDGLSGFWSIGAVSILKNGTSGKTEVQRTPGSFLTVATAAVGNTILWTPAAGKKFRLMKYMITVVDQATQVNPGTLTISLFDGAAGATGQVHDVFVPAVGLLNNGSLYSSGWITLDNGFLSAAANNALNINLSAALTAGTVRVICCGTEE